MNQSSSPPTAVATRMTAYINETQEQIVSRPGFGRLLGPHRITFASVASQPEYALPPSVAKVLSVRDISNQWRLRPMSLTEYQERVPAPASMTSTPDFYCLLGLGPVALRPSAAAEIFAVSTSAGDVQSLKFELITSTGAIKVGAKTLTGLTAVSLDTTVTTCVEIIDAYLSTVAIGTITLTEGLAGNTLTTINVGNTKEHYQRLALVPTPSGAVTYTVDYERDAIALVNATDEPVLPLRFHRMLVYGALMMEFEHVGDQTRYLLYEKRFNTAMGLLNHFVTSPPDHVTVPGGSGAFSPSILPAWYPQDGYYR